MSFYTFHVTIHARPPQTELDAVRVLRGCTLQSLGVAPSELDCGFAQSFEEVQAALEQLPRMFFEPDGSFVWKIADGLPRQQLDGLLFDRDGRVRFVELKGACAHEEFERFIAALGTPVEGCLFQLVREAIVLDDTAFCKYASASDSTESPVPRC